MKICKFQSFVIGHSIFLYTCYVWSAGGGDVSSLLIFCAMTRAVVPNCAVVDTFMCALTQTMLALDSPPPIRSLHSHCCWDKQHCRIIY